MHESGPPEETFVDQLDWHAFEPEELARMPLLPPGTLPLKLDGARWAHLDFYDDHLLIEIRFLNTDGPDRLYGIHSPERTSWLTACQSNRRDELGRVPHPERRHGSRVRPLLHVFRTSRRTATVCADRVARPDCAR